MSLQIGICSWGPFSELLFLLPFIFFLYFFIAFYFLYFLNIALYYFYHAKIYRENNL